MSILSALRGLSPPSLERSMASIASDLRTIRQLMEIQHTANGYELPLSKRDLKKQPTTTDDDEQTPISEERLIQQRISQMVTHPEEFEPDELEKLKDIL